MKILGAKVEKPVQWMAGNVLGTVVPAYDLLGQPYGELSGYLTTLGWIYAGLVIVRLLGLALLVAVRVENEEFTR